MNRMVARQLMRTSGISFGEVLVATEIKHPERGVVACPAAPLVAAAVAGGPGQSNAAAGSAVSVRLDPAEPVPDGDAILFVTSYVGGDGVALGLAAAAHAEDAAGVVAAQTAVAVWSAALRTRRVLRAVGGPLCPGARRAVGIVAAARTSGPIYVYGDLAGPADPAMVRVDDIEDVPRQASLVIPAHGVSPMVRSEATARELRIIDGTCPLVETAQAYIRAAVADEDTVLLLGRRGDAVVEGLRGQAPKQVILTETTADLMPRDIVGRVSFVLQPGVSVDELQPLVTAVRDRYTARGAHPGTWCYAASDRATALRTIAAESDVLLILGAADHSDTAHLVATVSGAKVHIVDDVGQIRPEWITSAVTIGLAETVSAPPGAAATIISVLSGIGPLSVAERTLATTLATTATRSAMTAPD